jgi:hypothetical protein
VSAGRKGGFGAMAAARPVDLAGEKLLAKMGDGEELARVHFQLEASKFRKLKIVAARRGESIRAVLTELIDTLPDE